MPKRKSCKKGYSRSRSTGRCVKKCKKGQTRSRISGKCKRSKKKSKAKRKRKRNDGSDSPKKDVSWVTYFKHYSNDEKFDLRRVNWTGYRGKRPAGLKIKVSRKSKSR